MTRLIDSRIDFLSPASVIPGLGPKRVAALAESGINNLGDLLYHFPRRYIDRSTITPLAQCETKIGSMVSVIATITKTRIERGRRSRMRIQLTDESGEMEALWFAGIAYFRVALHTGMRVLCTGVVTAGPKPQFVHPQIERIGEGKNAPDILFLPVYPLTTAMKDAGVLQKLLCKTILWALDNIKHYPQLLPQAVEQKHAFLPLDECIRNIHFPKNVDALEPFRARLVYEELYRLALTLRVSRKNFRLPGRSMRAGDLSQKLEAALPFTLTDDQKKAIAILHKDSLNATRMHRLLQGDVGSGKTIVALFACLPALNSGFQVAWLAPTEILARQTHRTVSSFLSTLGIRCELLVGQTPKDERRNILVDCAKGSLKCVVGTHALLGSQVTFCKIGMVVIDEQHKFGAQQRLQISQKDPASDVLVMSATPIPQTLAQTLYRDLDIVSIRAKPAGRLPVETHHVPSVKRADMERFILDQIMQHKNQVFYVAPCIEVDDESENGDPELKTVQSVVASLRRSVLSSVNIDMVHGRVDAEKSIETMSRFASGNIDILVATTVIEVGIDVPNATICVVENADRFGLSQLHQLRGRVGRSDKKSFCFLLTNALPESEAYKRIAYFSKHHDGFDIAEYDLQMRGPGEVTGYRQSGWEDMKIADILRDAKLFADVQNDIDSVMQHENVL